MDAAAAHLARDGVDDASPAPGSTRAPRALAVLHVARALGGGVVTLYLFTLALKLLSASAPGVARLLDRFAIDGVVNLIGFGWLAAYGALSGSPVAALALSLLDGGAITPNGALGMLAGSRMGASFVVLLVGFIAYARGRGRPDGLYVGVLALLTTIAIYVPATPIALWLLGSGLLDGPAQAIPGGWADVPAAAVRPAVLLLRGALPSAALFALGIGALLGAFALFDRLLPNLDPPSPRFERLSRRFGSPSAMFLFGALVTSVTMSVSLSVTILVPLTLKNILQRRDVVPYVMGANITTFLDTLFASLLLESPHGAPVVLAEMISVAAVSAVVFVAAWGPFCEGVLALAHRVIGRRTSLGAFLVVLFVAPLALIL